MNRFYYLNFFDDLRLCEISYRGFWTQDRCWLAIPNLQEKYFCLTFEGEVEPIVFQLYKKELISKNLNLSVDIWEVSECRGEYNPKLIYFTWAVITRPGEKQLLEYGDVYL